MIKSLILASLILVFACKSQNEAYKGTPYEHQVYKQGAQVVPGKLQCEYYDFGGEGIAFHDSDSVNSGSGGLNKDDGSYLHELRKPDFHAHRINILTYKYD